MKVDSGLPLVAVAIDRNKGSQDALKWAVNNITIKGQTLVLVHVNTKCTSTVSHEDDAPSGFKGPSDAHTRELFLPFRVFCTRKDINCQDVVLDDADVVKAMVEFVAHAAIEKLVLGAPSKSGFVRRFKSSDIPSNVSKGSPDFCTVYIISKEKVSSVRNAIRSAPAFSPLRPHNHNQCSIKPDVGHHCPVLLKDEAKAIRETHSIHDDSIKSPFMRGTHGVSTRSFADFSLSDTDISFVSSGRPSTSSGRPSADCAFTPRMSSTSDGFDRGLEMTRAPHKFMDSYSAGTDFSSLSQECSGTSWSSQTLEDVEAEMRRLRLELKQTMNMYDTACKEALAAKQKATELDHWRLEEEQRLREAQRSEESALALVERERAKSRAAIEAAEASRRTAELEAQKRIDAEMKALREAEDRKKASDSLAHANLRYRKYTIEEIEAATNYFADNRKIGEGGYGPVYKCYLDHTPVAIKVLRPDAAQGRSQFQQEVEILSCIRHPNMVLLLGACPKYGCLVYEYMANGSLDDRLFRRGNTPSIPWQHRFRIAAEIGTGLLFLHQTKPEPLVHRDLKPANILLDQNYVSKISDVGLARLVPPSVADNMTQCLMTSAAGTFCYIDPEYQQTGMLGVKSDIYSLGIMLLQLITAKSPMGLTHHVSRAIEKGMFKEMLDPTVPDWPVEEAMCLAQIALRCTELRRKDRPDLGTVVLPELDKLRHFAEEHTHHCTMGSSTYSSPIHSQVSLQDVMSDSLVQSGCDSFKSRSSTSSMTGRGLNAT